MQGRNITSTTAHCGAHTGKDILMLAGELMFSQYQAHTSLLACQHQETAIPLIGVSALFKSPGISSLLCCSTRYNQCARMFHMRMETPQARAHVIC
jgi:hypothetical protein